MLKTIWTAALVCAAPSLAVDFNFKAGTELARAFETISIIGKFNVVVCPGTANVEASYAPRGVEPADAMKMLASAHGLTVRRVQSGETPTYAVGKPEQIRERFENAMSRAVTLRWTSPKQVAAQIANQIDSGVLLSGDERTRTLMVRGPEEAIAKVEQLVQALDVPMAQVRVNLVLSAGAPGKLEPVWTGAQVVESGQEAHFEVSETGKGSGWRVVKLAGSFQVNVNAQNFSALKGRLDAELEGPSGPVKTAITSQVSAGDAATVQLGRHELGGERALTLTAKVETLDREGLAGAVTAPGVPMGNPPPIPSGPPPIGPVPPGAGPGAPGSGALPPSGPPPGPPPSAPVPDEIDQELDSVTIPSPIVPSPAPSPDGKLEIDPEL